jgi:hypothetical protein
MSMSMSVTVLPPATEEGALPQSKLSALLGAVSATALIASTLGFIPVLTTFLLCKAFETPLWMTLALEGLAGVIVVFGLAWFSRQAWVYEREHSAAWRKPVSVQTAPIIS